MDALTGHMAEDELSRGHTALVLPAWLAAAILAAGLLLRRRDVT
jgi:hypothetical protein